MGIFWSSKKEKPAPPAPPAQTEEEKDPRLEPLTAGYFVYNKYREEGKLECGPDFAYLFRDMHDCAKKNNNMIYKSLQMIKELVEENKELRERLDRIERQLDDEPSSPRARAI